MLRSEVVTAKELKRMQRWYMYQSRQEKIHAPYVIYNNVMFATRKTILDLSRDPLNPNKSDASDAVFAHDFRRTMSKWKAGKK